MRLTKSSIIALEHRKTSQDIYWDDTLPGFGVRVYEGGAKSFVVRYRVGGRKRLLVIGPTHLLSPEDARERARLVLVDALSEKDPLNTKAFTLRKFCEIYIERHAKPHKDSWKEDKRRIDLYLLPGLGNRLISSIKRAEIATLHAQIGKTKPIQANRVLEMISTMWNKAKLWGYLDEQASDIVSGITAFRENDRDRYLQATEAPRFVAALKEEEPRIRALILVLWLTGLRKMSVMSLKWTDLDTTRKEVHIRSENDKAGRGRYVPLPDKVLEFLDGLPRDSAYIFPGKTLDRHLTTIRTPWDRICKRANISDFHPHDLRRTLGSELAHSGQSLHLIGEVLGQTTQHVTAKYARFAQNHVKSALQANCEIVSHYLEGLSLD